MKAVYRKEMRQYFHSVIGYVFLAIFVFINAFYFLLQNLLTRSGDITDYFRATITLEMFLMPMLTMRSFSEEKSRKRICCFTPCRWIAHRWCWPSSWRQRQCFYWDWP